MATRIQVVKDRGRRTSRCDAPRGRGAAEVEGRIGARSTTLSPCREGTPKSGGAMDSDATMVRRLSGLMALIYAVQGAWWPLLAVHLQDLGISGRCRGWIFATMALGSLATPLGMGQLADRRMPTQRLLALIYALGTGLLATLALGLARRPGPLFLIFLAYWLITAPGYGLTNSLTLRNLPRPREQFGRVRLWGTVGWMAVGWAVSLVLAWSGTTEIGEGTFEAFWVAAALSVATSLYCLGFVPHTPPLAIGGRARLGRRELLALAGRRPVWVYLISAFGFSLTTPYMYQVIPAYLEARGLPRPWIASALTLGQVFEVLALVTLPWMFRRFGYRGTLLLGVAAWVVRYGSLVVDPPLWVGLAGVLLHGIGVACFLVGGQVFLDAHAPDEYRASAQAINMVVTTGVGSLLGSVLAGEVVSRSGGDWRVVFLVPGLISVGLLCFVGFAFRPDSPEVVDEESGGPRIAKLVARSR